jgi:hypothetical protein
LKIQVYWYSSLNRSNFTEISNIRVVNSGKAIVVENSRIDLMNNCTFIGNENSSNKSGVLDLYNTDIVIKNSTFSKNKAEIGASVFFNWASKSLWKLVIIDSSFVSNTAYDKGGAIYYGFKRPELINVYFFNNSALYGPNIASYAVKIQMQGNESKEMELNNVGPSIPMENSLSFVLMDYEDQVIETNNVNEITISPVNRSVSSIVGSKSVLLKNGVATFFNFTATSTPGSSNVKFRASSKAIDTAKINKIYGSPVSENLITINFRHWMPGEFKFGNRCIECSAGSFSLEWNSNSWKPCLAYAFCPGKNVLEIDSGYWRSGKNSTNIIECINTIAWEGGYYPENTHPVKCRKGYTGVLCFDWVNEKGNKYQKVGESSWEKCPHPLVNAFRFFGLGILVFAFMMVLIAINVRKRKENEVSVLIRIMTNYLQLMVTIMSFTPVFPKTLFAVLAPVKRLGDASETFLSFDWFVTDYEIKGSFPSNEIFKIFLTAFMPIFITMITGMIWIAVKIIMPKWAPDLKRCWIISFVSIMFFLHPKLAEESLKVFRWIDIDEGSQRARIDTRMNWYSNEHLFWWVVLGLPILTVWVVGAPLTALILLIRNFKKGSSNKINQYLLILYQGFRYDNYYWEFMNTIRKMWILFMLLLPDHIKILISCSVLTATARLQIKLMPYKNVENNRLEILAITACLVTLLSYLAFLEDNRVEFMNTFLLVLLIVLNAKFIFEWTYRMSLCMKDKNRFWRGVSIIYLIL